MIDGACIFDDVSDGAHRLIGKSLKPEDARKRGSSRQSLVMLKADGVRSASGDDRAAKHTLDVAPRIGLVSQVMQRKPDHSIADEQVGPVGLPRRKTAEPLGKRQRQAMLAIVGAKRPKTPERPQLILGIVEALGDLEH